MTSGKNPQKAASWSRRAEAVQYFKKAFVDHPATVDIRDSVERLIAFGSLNTAVGTSASTFLLTGAPGSGKTALLRDICREHPPRCGEDSDIYPVLYVEVPPSQARKALAEAILDALGAYVPARSTGNQLLDRAVHHLRHQGVKLLILDEAQHLVNPEQHRLNYEAADWVKSLANRGASAILLSGMPEAAEVFRYNGQLSRRSLGRANLGALRFSVTCEFAAFLHVLQAFRQGLDVEGCPDLGAPVLAAQLHLQCGGLVGRLADFLAQVLGIATQYEPAVLTTECFRRAAAELCDPDDPTWENPFEVTSLEVLEARMLAAEGVDHPKGIRPTSLRRGTRNKMTRDVLP